MTDDPKAGVSSAAMAAASQEPMAGAEEAAETVVDAAVGTLAGHEENFVRRTRNAARDRLSRIQEDETLLEAGSRAVKRGRRYLDERLPEPQAIVRQGRSAIQGEPAAALLVAGAIGFGLGWLIHRRND